MKNYSTFIIKVVRRRSDGQQDRKWQRFVLALMLLHGAAMAASTESENQLRLMKIERPFAYYEGSVVVSGLYHEKIRESEIGNFEAGLICFSVRGETEKLIPRDRDPRSPWFCFSNTEEARAAFKVPSDVPKGTCYIVGTATIKISKYVVDKTESEVHDTANLDKVITFSKPEFKKECSLR